MRILTEKQQEQQGRRRIINKQNGKQDTTKSIKKNDHDTYKLRLIGHLLRHIGRENAVGMGELYRLVWGKPYTHKINHTRELRYYITELREEGHAICSDTSGYYVARAGSELEAFCARQRRRALKTLQMEARIRKMTLPDLMGQIRLTLIPEVEHNA